MYVNKKNGHKYIGLTNHSEIRYKDHLLAAYNPDHKDYKQTIHKAIRKYGIENFDFILLEKDLPSREKMKEREQYWIKHYNTYEDRSHYNETPGGDCPGFNTVHRGEEHGRALLSEKDVIFCREEYFRGSRSRDIYNQYFSEKVSWGGFLRMWHGKTWKHVMPEVFKNNLHRAKYGAADRDIILALYKESGMSISEFSQQKECYVGYGTLYRMINEPSFYDNK